MALIATTTTFCQSDWHTKVIENNISVKLPDNSTYKLNGKSGVYAAKTSNNMYFVIVQYDVLPRYSDFVQLPESSQIQAIKVFMDNAIKGALKASGNEGASYWTITLKDLPGREATYYGTDPGTGNRGKKITKMYYAYNKVITFSTMALNNSDAALKESNYFFNSINK